MKPPKVAPITGVTGQDGAYLSELLLSKDYEVRGIKRHASLFNIDRIDRLYQDPHVRFFDGRQRSKLHYGDLTDSANLIRMIQQVQTDKIYNLAALSHVAGSLEPPRVHRQRQRRRHRDLANPRSHSHPRPGEEGPLLPDQRAVRPGAGNAA